MIGSDLALSTSQTHIRTIPLLPRPQRGGGMDTLEPCEAPARVHFGLGFLTADNRTTALRSLEGGCDEYGQHTPSARPAPAGARLLDLPGNLCRRPARHRRPPQE